jgi:dienelactone hydrolase
LIFFPGAYAATEKDLKSSNNSIGFIDYLVKSGRAVMYPVYKGTFERNDGLTPAMRSVNHSHQYTEWQIKWVKDFSRSVDYLETRTDIDSKRLGFYGHSWGAEMGGIVPAVEKRLAVNVLVVGGFPGIRPYPEADIFNYLPHVKIPTLMLNGKYDVTFPYDSRVKPFFDLLGTPEKDKHFRVFETDHYVPRSEMIKEVLNWLDKYFGPVNYMPNK